MDRDFILSSGGQQIIEALKNVLDAAIHLYDAEECVRYAAVRKRWMAGNGMPDTPPGVCHVRARINERWTLHVFRRPSLHPDAQSIAVWAADKLALHLPRRTADDPMCPPFGGGGTSGGLRRDRHPDLVGA